MANMHVEEDAHGDGIDTQMVGIVAVVSTIALAVLIVGLQVVYYQMEQAQTQAKVVDQKSSEKADLWSRQRIELSGYRWVDKGTQRVTIPIAQAMKRVVHEENEARARGAHAVPTVQPGSGQAATSSGAIPKPATAVGAPTGAGAAGSVE